ncbi:MAG: tripartite tricarboxylate transporter substrate binding protein [Burkholderiaceae bacterium]
MSTKRFLIPVLRGGALRIGAAAVLAGVAFASSPAGAQGGGRAIELVVPFAPGGSTDSMARLAAPKLAQQLGVPVAVVNKPGAAGLIGTSYALLATDGSRIMTGGNSNLGPVLALGGQATYTIDDVAALGMATTNTLLIVSRPGRFENFEALAREARAKPDSGVSIGSWGVKSPAHFYVALLGQQLSSNFLHVPFDGGAKAMLATMGGEIDAAVVTVSTALTNVQSGKLTALAVTSAARSVDLPKVPSIKELGLPEAEYVSFDGFAVSAKVPRERLEALRSAMSKVLADPDFKERMRKIGAEPTALSGSDYDAFLRRNIQTLSAIAARTPIKD